MVKYIKQDLAQKLELILDVIRHAILRIYIKPTIYNTYQEAKYILETISRIKD
jgi:hypothetical protein